MNSFKDYIEFLKSYISGKVLEGGEGARLENIEALCELLGYSIYVPKNPIKNSMPIVEANGLVSISVEDGGKARSLHLKYAVREKEFVRGDKILEEL